jgi:O-methyltransferase
MGSGYSTGTIERLITKIRYLGYYNIYRAFKGYTMIPVVTYIQNLRLADHFRAIEGSVVECGTWRGGMIGGIAKLLGNRDYYLFDSFEGLPEAKEIDGAAAIQWQNDKDSPLYLNNCTAEMAYAEKAMSISGVSKYHIKKGWFSDTLPHFDKSKKIAILRLDGDWYESTMDCLNNLYDCVVPGGIIIMDDYHVWDGCSRAVHDFLSRRGVADRICQWDDTVCYIIKHPA